MNFNVVKQQHIIDTADGSVFSSILMLAQITKMKNEYTFENANVQKFIKSTGHFDVIVAEEFFCDGLYMFAHKYKAPIVTISKCGFCQLTVNTLRWQAK